MVSKNQIYTNHSKLNETESLGASEEDGDTLVWGGRGDSSAETTTNQISDSSLSTNNVNRDKNKEEDHLHIARLLTYFRKGKIML